MLEKVFENKTTLNTVGGVLPPTTSRGNKAIADHDDKVYLGIEKLSSETEPSFNDINPKDMGQQ